mmetsp:Transcript_18589/g.52574  ORF Transcript_18589/g.52574 Transcript_18589/m.52574 type:complete len:213 (-) Transcript_18589:105-743(-)
MRAAASRGRLHRGHPAEAEVVHFEHVPAAPDHGRGAGFLEVPHDDLLHFAALGAHRRGVPNLHQQRLEVVREPEALRVGVLQGEQDVLVREDCPLGHRLDDNWQVPTVLLQDVLPRLAIEQLAVVAPDRVREVHLEVFLGVIDGLGRDHRSDHVLLEVVLESEKAHLGELTAAALEVGVDLLSARRVLQMMGDLIRVREQDYIVEHVPDYTK